MTKRASTDVSKDVERKLGHGTLQELEERGYIEWDSTSQTIQKGPNFDELVPLLESMEHPDDLPTG